MNFFCGCVHHIEHKEVSHVGIILEEYITRDILYSHLHSLNLHGTRKLEDIKCDNKTYKRFWRRFWEEKARKSDTYLSQTTLEQNQ